MTRDHDAPVEPERESELFIAFANTRELVAGEPHDHVPDFTSLAAWLRDRGLLKRALRPGHDAERRLAAFRELRELIHAIVARLGRDGEPGRDQVRALNAVLKAGLHYHELRRIDGESRYAVAQVGDELDHARSSIAGSLAHFLAEHDPDRVRICANERCRWLFIDRSPAGRRRWCDMRVCGNRAKAARHRQRARTRSAATGV